MMTDHLEFSRASGSSGLAAISIRQYCHGSIEQYAGKLDLWASILTLRMDEMRLPLPDLRQDESHSL
jgi:hypothetical protein